MRFKSHSLIYQMRHLRLSLLNNFYCGILHLYILGFLHKVSNICKPEEGWYGQPTYCYKKRILFTVGNVDRDIGRHSGRYSCR